MRREFFILALSCACLIHPVSAQPAAPESPAWVKDLVIYEIATKGFTSPHGPETGTFNSLRERIPYLRDLGITAVWLTGHSLADGDHFYGIWTQYACIRPDSIDPSLGTPQDLRRLVDEFHRAGIRVFLDLITHGVTNDSPLIREHPEWFKGGSWGMTDYDWQGNHKDLEDWWVKTHTDYAVNYGVDGYRLDCGLGGSSPAMWTRLRENCARANHSIALCFEGDYFAIGGAGDFVQGMNMVSTVKSEPDTAKLVNRNIARLYQSQCVQAQHYYVSVNFADGTNADGSNDKIEGTLKVSVVNQPAIVASNAKYDIPAGRGNIELAVSNIDSTRRITSIYVEANGRSYEMGSSDRDSFWMSGAASVHLSLKPVIPDLKYYSTQISCHDNGWDGFLSSNPYVVKGCRSIMGYSGLLAPGIPIFMSGEEFDAAYVPLPRLKPDLYGKKSDSKGTWLYGSMIQWDQLTQRRHADMLADVKRMLLIRREESDVIHAGLNSGMPRIEEVAGDYPGNIPVPYILFNEKKIILVAANPSPEADLSMTLNVPLGKTDLKDAAKVKVTDLWNNTEIGIMPATELKAYALSIRKDQIKGGGLAVLKFERIE